MKESPIIRLCGWWGSHHKKQYNYLKTKTPPLVIPAEAGIQTYFTPPQTRKIAPTQNMKESPIIRPCGWWGSHLQ